MGEVVIEFIACRSCQLKGQVALRGAQTRAVLEHKPD